MGLRSFFLGNKPQRIETGPSVAQQDPGKKGGESLRSLVTIIGKAPTDIAKEYARGLFSVSIASFEESYVGARRADARDSDFREAFVTRTLLGDLVDGNYIGFLAMHALIFANRLQGWEWLPTSQEEIEHVGEMASLFLIHPHYQLTPEQQAKEKVILSEDHASKGTQALVAVIETAQWDVARTVMCAAMDTLSRNLMEVWAGPEAHEKLVYQTLILSLRVDNTLGALLLHQLAISHHQRGWDWRPSPDEFHAIAEISARQLIDKRYNVAALVR